MSEPQPQAEWTLARVLALMDEQGRTGILEVSVGVSVTRIHLRRGHVVYAEPTAGARAWPLGEYLVESDTITPGALLEAKERCELLDVALDEYLIDKRLVSEDVLKRFADLHVAEVLFPLFLRTNLNIRFLDERPSNPRLITALPVSYVLKEADRRAEVWPPLRQAVGGLKAVYGKDSSALAEILAYVAAPADEEDQLPEISAGARVVFFYVNSSKTLEQLARASGLGVFETYRAIGELLDADLVGLVEREGAGEQPVQRSPHLTKLVTIVTYLALAGLLALGVQWVVGNADMLETSLTASSPRIRELVIKADIAQIESALEVYFARHGAYPETLDELREAGYVGREVVDVFGNVDYVSSGRTRLLRRKVQLR